jgi:DNA-binding transcriptional ArsR family regulator
MNIAPTLDYVPAAISDPTRLAILDRLAGGP